MIRKMLSVIFLSSFLMSCSSQKHLKLMTYNIRLDVASDGENAWPNRKDFLSSQVLFLDPDVLGVQEAKPNQIMDLDATLTEYDHFGLGRNGGSEDEHSAIYFKKDKLNVEEQNTIWLSETPNEVSKGWDAAFPRICTYGKFSFKDGGKKFWVFNTHLDHRGSEARKEGMKVILRKIQEVNVDGYPVILMGDFNVEPDSEVITEVNMQLVDSKEIADIDFGPDGTANSFKYNDPVLRRIDYIFVSKSPEVKVKKYAVLSSAVDFKFPSDHFPVFIEVNF